MKYVFKMMTVVFATGVLVLQGCLTTNTAEQKADASPKFFNKKKQVIKKPQYAPYDWQPSDATSREVWFEKKFKGYWCSVFFSKSGWKSIFLRNDNVITELYPSISKKYSSSSYTKDLIDISFSPQKKVSLY